MKITVYNCTQKSLIGYYSEVDYNDINNILENKKGILCKYINNNECVGIYEYSFDYIIRLGEKRFILQSSNMSIWIKTSSPIPSFAFGDRSFVIRR